MTLLVLIGSSLTSSGFNFILKPVYLISGYIQDDMFKSSKSYEFSKYYDNYVRVSTDNNKKEPTDDLCGKLLEGCEPSAKKNETSPKGENNNLESIYNKYFEQGGPATSNTTSPRTNESLITSGGARETPSGQSNLTVPLEARYQTYENSTLGIKMQYPSNWKVEGFRDSLRFVSSKEDTNDKYIQTIDLFTYPNMSLNQAVDSLTNYYNTSLTNLTIIGSPHASVGANSSSVSLFYAYNDNTTGAVKSMDFIVSPEGSDKTYLFTFRDEASKFQRDLPEAQKIKDSIKFLK
jgi:hypothetical protein